MAEVSVARGIKGSMAHISITNCPSLGRCIHYLFMLLDVVGIVD
jgi:hypothetical protein